MMFVCFYPLGFVSSYGHTIPGYSKKSMPGAFQTCIMVHHHKSECTGSISRVNGQPSRFHRNKDFIGEVLSFLSRPYPQSNAIRLCKVEMADSPCAGFGHYKILGIQMYAAVSPCAVRFFSYYWSPWCLFATSTFLHNKNGLQIGGT